MNSCALVSSQRRPIHHISPVFSDIGRVDDPSEMLEEIKVVVAAGVNC